jgi:hypothetical protein
MVNNFLRPGTARVKELGLRLIDEILNGESMNDVTGRILIAALDDPEKFPGILFTGRGHSITEAIEHIRSTCAS